MRIGRFVSSGAIAGAALAGFFAIALAATVIEERQDVMESNGDAMKPLAAIAKNEAPFDAAVVKASGEEIAAGLTKAKDLFPEGSAEGDTRAKPEIWAEKDDFNKRLEGTIAAAQKLAAVTEQADFLPALGELGNGCKGCHDKYRRPED
jgi:cytochrome c556